MSEKYWTGTVPYPPEAPLNVIVPLERRPTSSERTPAPPEEPLIIVRQRTWLARYFPNGRRTDETAPLIRGTLSVYPTRASWLPERTPAPPDESLIIVRQRASLARCSPNGRRTDETAPLIRGTLSVYPTRASWLPERFGA